MKKFKDLRVSLINFRQISQSSESWEFSVDFLETRRSRNGTCSENSEAVASSLVVGGLKRALEICPISRAFRNRCAKMRHVPPPAAKQTRTKIQSKQKGIAVKYATDNSPRATPLHIAIESGEIERAEKTFHRSKTCLFPLFLLSYPSSLVHPSGFSRQGNEINSAFLRNWRAPRAEDIFSGPLLHHLLLLLPPLPGNSLFHVIWFSIKVGYRPDSDERRSSLFS